MKYQLKPFDVLAGCSLWNDDEAAFNELALLLAKWTGKKPQEIAAKHDAAEWLQDIEKEVADYAEANDLLPPFCYLDWQDGEFTVIPYTPDNADCPSFEDIPEYIQVINDHGNVTLYKVNVEEVWGMV